MPPETLDTVSKLLSLPIAVWGFVGWYLERRENKLLTAELLKLATTTVEANAKTQAALEAMSRGPR